MERTKDLVMPVARLRKDVVQRITKNDSGSKLGNETYQFIPSYNSLNQGLDFLMSNAVIEVPNHICYLSDYFMNEFRRWRSDSYIFINCGTGTGKTTFIERISKLKEFNVLILTNRTANREQILNHLDFKNNKGLKQYVKVMSYQVLEKTIDFTSDYLDTFDYIFCDEAHYFLQDSTFNSMVNVSLNKILNTKRAVKIFVSATNERIQQNIVHRLSNRYQNDLIVLSKVLIYEMRKSETLIRRIISFESFESDIKNEILNSEEQWLIFVKSIDIGREWAYQLSKVLKDKVIFLDRDSADQGTSVQRNTFKMLIDDEQFEQKVLITTCLLDNGINIRTQTLKNIVIFDDDPVEIIQMIGRKRKQNMNDYFDLYLLNESNQSLGVSLSNAMRKKNKFQDVQRDIEVYKNLNIIHYLNSKDGDEYRAMSYYNYYIRDYSYNYLGYSQICNEIKNLCMLRNIDSPFDLKVEWVMSKLYQNNNVEIITSDDIKRVEFLNSIDEILNVFMPYNTRKDQKAYHKLISNKYWRYFKKHPGERQDRPLSISNLKSRFVEKQISLDFEIKNGCIKLIRL